MPSSSGETLDGVHDRTAYALDRIIAAIDKDPRQPTSLLICTHAATMIAAGRALTGLMPDNHEDADFKAFTCSVSRFERRPGHEASSASPSSLYPANAASTKTSGDFDIEWRGGRGVGGGWDCVVNGDCSFLSGGEERGW
jgi:transcription factor C subunit 7